MTGVQIVTQHRFHPTRQWRLDFAFPDLKLGIEIQGYGKGHAEYTSMAKDHIKNNEAVLHGWQIIYLMSYQLTEAKIKSTISYVHKIYVSRQSGTITETTTVGVDIKSLFKKLHNGRTSK